MYYNFAGKHIRGDDNTWTLYDRFDGTAIMTGTRAACHERALASLPAWERTAWELGCRAAGTKNRRLDFDAVAKAAGVKDWYALGAWIQISAQKMFNKAVDYTQHHGGENLTGATRYRELAARR